MGMSEGDAELRVPHKMRKETRREETSFLTGFLWHTNLRQRKSVISFVISDLGYTLILFFLFYFFLFFFLYIHKHKQTLKKKENKQTNNYSALSHLFYFILFVHSSPIALLQSLFYKKKKQTNKTYSFTVSDAFCAE